MISIQRYRVSLWTYQSCLPGESPRYLRKETVSSSVNGALHGIMRQASIASAHCAKVVDVRTGACQLVKNVCVELN